MGSVRSHFVIPRVPPILVAALAHAAALAGVLLLNYSLLAPIAGWRWVEGACAAVLGKASGLPNWWLPINLLFLPAAQLLSGAPIPPLLFLVAFCALLATNFAAWRERVPLYLTSAKAISMLVSLLPSRPGFRFIDVGSGTGSVLTALARARPDGHFAGVEVAPLTYWISRWRTRNNPTVHAVWGDLWGADLARYDVVYAYLSPLPMLRLWRKAQSEMRPGSLLISNSFVIPGAAPTQTIALGDRPGSTLFLWRM